MTDAGPADMAAFRCVLVVAPAVGWPEAEAGMKAHAMTPARRIRPITVAAPPRRAGCAAVGAGGCSALLGGAGRCGGAAGGGVRGRAVLRPESVKCPSAALPPRARFHVVSQKRATSTASPTGMA